MHDTPNEVMNAENVEQFDIWIFEADTLVVSVVPHSAPLNASIEKYEVREQ
ncbi:hypothetical protein [Occallatibacter riparius]|uniref:Uncharacterized protein n=1 Tax=Occallatibacter riparius TaxID=1002689 RepID=A0A9J7BW12_9BACT|nr:hypothetical protein [Occallatibacter riparius]UWZ85197.1 hypothetical protein MOP44_04455 [Occallatibacter riparius]